MKKQLIGSSLPAFLALIISGIAMPSASGSGGSWMATGSMGSERFAHTATILANGKVLVAGRRGGISSLTAELYDPSTATWAPTGEMIDKTYWHTATLLPDGKVLVAGGCGSTGGYLARAELYNPATGTWQATGSMINTRGLHTATLMQNGKVLVAGGSGIGYPLRTEVYDPTTGKWKAVGEMHTASYEGHTATKLPNGKVLVVGGYDNYYLSRAELFDPETETWTTTGQMNYHRRYHVATLLPNGKVLVAGGEGYNGGFPVIAEIYDPKTGTWTTTGSLSDGRSSHTATLLPSGLVLVAAGVDRTFALLSSAELYSPVSGAWTTVGSLATPRHAHTATLLQSGRVLVAGGVSSGPLSSAELFEPGPFTVTLLAAQHGEINGNTSPYVLGTTAILTAVASPGYVFIEWTGDFADSDNPISILMDADKSVGAKFSPDTSDTDDDGLSTYEEVVIYGTAPAKPDTDGDGFLDGYEVYTGKSPVDIEDKPALVAEVRTAIEFTFPAAVGKTYRIEHSFDLATWTTVEDGIAGNGSVIQRFYTTRDMPKRYFRVEESAP